MSTRLYQSRFGNLLLRAGSLFIRGEVAAMALPGVVVMRTGISIDGPYANQLAQHGGIHSEQWRRFWCVGFVILYNSPFLRQGYRQWRRYWYVGFVIVYARQFLRCGYRQWRRYRYVGFVIVYARQFLRCGYRHMPLEIEAPPKKKKAQRQ